MPTMNIFRILGDVCHTASKCILIRAIISNKSAEGVSLLTQLLYMLVFCTRYLDLFWVAPWWSWWNTVLKIFYIASSIHIVWLMMHVYARTREKEYAWKLAMYGLVASAVGAPLVGLLFHGTKGWIPSEMLWTFSIILESICILPQLLLLRQTAVPTVLDSYYLIALGSYRAFYILNWILRLASSEHYFEPISVIFGVIQTALYVDFAWVYYSRQRVKLRGGGVVDSDDLSKSYLVRRFIGRGTRADREDDGIVEDGAALAGHEDGTMNRERWGPRGLSVSADDTLHEHDRQKTTAATHTPLSFSDADGEHDAEMVPTVLRDVIGTTAAYENPQIDPDKFEDDMIAPRSPAKSDDRNEGPVDNSSSVWAEGGK